MRAALAVIVGLVELDVELVLQNSFERVFVQLFQRNQEIDQLGFSQEVGVEQWK